MVSLAPTFWTMNMFRSLAYLFHSLHNTSWRCGEKGQPKYILIHFGIACSVICSTIYFPSRCVLFFCMFFFLLLLFGWSRVETYKSRVCMFINVSLTLKMPRFKISKSYRTVLLNSFLSKLFGVYVILSDLFVLQHSIVDRQLIKMYRCDTNANRTRFFVVVVVSSSNIYIFIANPKKKKKNSTTMSLFTSKDFR